MSTHEEYHSCQLQTTSTPKIYRLPALHSLLSPSTFPPLLPPPPHSYPPPTPVNPSQLPDEVLLSIFNNLSHAKDIAAVRGVCNSWRTIVDHAHSIWRHLIFDLPRCPSTAQYAEVWYRKAADYGNAQAQFMLALLYTYGYGNRASQPAIRYTL